MDNNNNKVTDELGDRTRFLSDQEDKELSAKISKILEDCTINLLISKPFFGRIITTLQRVDSTEWCTSVATDGRTFYYNRNFIATLTEAEISFTLAHIVMHCVYSHVGRRGARNKSIHEMATDYQVNYILVEEKVGKMPKFGLYDKRFHDELTTDETYEILFKEWQNNKLELKMSLDEHLDAEGDEDEEGEGQDGGGQADVDVHGKKGKPKLSKADVDQIQNELKAKLIQSAQMSRMGAGDLPRGIERLIAELLEPKMNWSELIESHIKSSVRDDYTFARMSKRSFTNRGGFLFPAQDVMETINVCVSIDTSGSISHDMIVEMLSEVKGIMQTFADFKLSVWSFDTKVYSFKEFTPENIDEIDEYLPKGGGGTDFEVNWQFMKDHEIEPEKFIMFTDGYPCGGWGDEAYCDTLFVIHGTKTIVAPFGMTAYYEFTHDSH